VREKEKRKDGRNARRARKVRLVAKRDCGSRSRVRECAKKCGVCVHTRFKHSLAHLQQGTEERNEKKQRSARHTHRNPGNSTLSSLSYLCLLYESVKREREIHRHSSSSFQSLPSLPFLPLCSSCTKHTPQQLRPPLLVSTVSHNWFSPPLSSPLLPSPPWPFLFPSSPPSLSTHFLLSSFHSCLF